MANESDRRHRYVHRQAEARIARSMQKQFAVPRGGRRGRIPGSHSADSVTPPLIRTIVFIFKGHSKINPESITSPKEWLIADQRRCEKSGGHADDRHQRPPRRAMDWPDVPAEPPDVSLALPQATLELPHPTFKPSHVTSGSPRLLLAGPPLPFGLPHLPLEPGQTPISNQHV